MKIIVYSILLFFSIGTIVAEIINDYKSFKLVSYSFNPAEHYIKDKLYYTDKLGGDNSTGSEGEYVYYGIIQSSGKKGNIRGWINQMEEKRIYDKEKQQYYFNIWYCPKLNIIMGLVKGDINSAENAVFHGRLTQSWLRIIMFFLSIPLSLKIYNIKK